MIYRAAGVIAGEVNGGEVKLGFVDVGQGGAKTVMLADPEYAGVDTKTGIGTQVLIEGIVKSVLSAIDEIAELFCIAAGLMSK